MLRVYFDTNVYDRIEKGEVAVTDLATLRSALSHGKLIANLSIAGGRHSEVRNQILHRSRIRDSCAGKSAVFS